VQGKDLRGLGVENSEARHVKESNPDQGPASRVHVPGDRVDPVAHDHPDTRDARHRKAQPDRGGDVDGHGGACGDEGRLA
jgi:hypothetical protein